MPLCNMVVKMTWLPCSDSCLCQLCSLPALSVPAVRREMTKINVQPGEARIIGLLANIIFFAFRGDDGGNQMETEK